MPYFRRAIESFQSLFSEHEKRNKQIHSVNCLLEKKQEIQHRIEKNNEREFFSAYRLKKGTHSNDKRLPYYTK